MRDETITRKMTEWRGKTIADNDHFNRELTDLN